MAEAEPVRTRAARRAAELALVRVVQHYGARPEFVLLGGLVPDLLCSDTSYLHAGTTDIDVQVDLEIARGSVNTARLEQALRNAEFVPSEKGIWRWTTVTDDLRAEVKFELLADQDDVPTQQVVRFDDCAALGAVNLRGTGVAARDTEVRQVGTVSAHRTDLVELRANFTTPSDQGPKAYAEQLVIDHPKQDPSEAVSGPTFAAATVLRERPPAARQPPGRR